MRIKLYLVITFVLMMMLPVASADTLNVGGIGPGNYTTIQNAINASNDSDTIFVYNGTYTENVDVNKSVTIISETGNPDDTKVQAAFTDDYVFNVTRDNVTINGFNITGATNYNGIFLDRVQNNDISNNEVSYNRDGIYLNDSSNNTLTNNNVSNNRFDGIELSYSNNNALTNNNASINSRGIRLVDSSNNMLNNNTVSNSGSDGIDFSYSNNNVLTNNNVFYSEDGIYLSRSNNNTLENNNASYNKYDGIRLFESSNNTIDNNNAFYNGDDGGFYLSRFSNNNTLNNNNALYNDKNGISLSSSSNNKLINNNASNNINDNGIRISSSNNNILKGNVICNNTKYGIELSNGDDNTIYNNFFNNTNNTQIDSRSTGNIWNITNTSGPNIVGGLYLGGNYWAEPDGTGHSQTCTDTNNDGFCDEEFNIAENNNDSLPLTINASVDIEKYTNGEDADEPEGPTIQMGSQVTWTYNVTNTGSVILYNITVTDDKLGEISCPNSTLEPGEYMVCTKTGSAQSGQYSNIGNVTAQYKDDLCAESPTSRVIDSDPSHYFGYDHWAGVPTANPVLLIGVLGIAVLLFLRREQK